jgi:DNA ligase 1
MAVPRRIPSRSAKWVITDEPAATPPARMKAFAALYAALDASTASLDKIAALHAYFAQVTPADAACALGILLGQKQPASMKAAQLRATAAASSGLALWLVEDSYAHVGDLAETCALLAVQDASSIGQELDSSAPLHVWCTEHLPMLAKLAPDAQIAQLQAWWRGLEFAQRLVLNKLLTGGLRVGVAQGMVVRALMLLSGLSADVLAHRLMGGFTVSAAAWQQLIDADTDADIDARRSSLPYPFFLASPLFAVSPVRRDLFETSALATVGESEIGQVLGEVSDWQVEWKWDGIRAQLIQRTGSAVFWSRGEERLDGRFPELERAAAALPMGTVLDGEIVCWKPDGARPENFLALQKRINTRKPSTKLLASHPVRFVAYDCLEHNNIDIRAQPQRDRCAVLAQLLPGLQAQSNTTPHYAQLATSTLLQAHTIAQLQQLRAQAAQYGAEGLMLKRLSAAYQVGRKRGDWWKWKLDPLSIDAVLIYAQAGHGRRANLYTDYTFALWQDGQLVPVAKAYSGLSDSEITQLDKWIRSHTRERFGPVRSVQPLQVFELGFEAVQVSTRHKSGVAVRFPRILRWRTDKSADQADQLDALKALA